MAEDKKVKSVIEMVAEQPDVDRSSVFERLWGIFGEMREKVDARFELTLDPSTADLETYQSLPEFDASGSLKAYSGDEIDWFIHSWIGNPKKSFANMHLTLWLPPTIKVPHLGFALATLPDVFCYMDYIPRVDLQANADYLDKYYEPANKRSVELQENPDLKYFYSRDLYTRQALSETAICYTGQPTEDNLTLINEMAHEMLDRWIGWIDAGDPVPEEEQAAMAKRDLYVRRTIAERDPANALAEKMFGKEMTDRLVTTLWGGNSTLPRLGATE